MPAERFFSRLALGLSAALCALPVQPCTTFVADGAHGPLFARNYDFEVGAAMVVVNPRGLSKSAEGVGDARKAAWTAKHGSVTFNQFGVGLPTGGVNEAGLVMELMWLDGTRYPEADPRPAVSTLQFIQYVLDQADSVDAALREAQAVRIAGRTPLHFLIADRAGNAASIEFLEGRLVVHRGSDMPVRVLANDTYAASVQHLQQLQRNERPTGHAAVPRDTGSLSRFARAAAASGSTRDVPQAFAALDNVAQPGSTHWQIVYDLAQGRVHYRTQAARAARWLDLSRIDFACARGLRTMDIDAGAGSRDGAWRPYTQKDNEAQMLTAYRKTSFLRDVPEQAVRDAAAYPATMRCAA